MVEDAEFADVESAFIPTGSITSWEGEPTMNGSGKFAPWSIEEENIQRTRKKDIITVVIKIPPPEPEIVIEDEEEMESFEWVTSKGKKEEIKVDKGTLTKLSHPKIYICSLCDRNFVSIDINAKCPWCTGKAIFLQEI